jgi:hypothetical protein
MRPVGLAQLAQLWRSGQRKLRRSGYQRRAENVSDGQHPVRDTEGHGRCAVAILALQTRDRLAQRFVRTGQMIIESKPVLAEMHIRSNFHLKQDAVQ